MRYAYTADQMRIIENRAIEAGVATLGGLMERAGAELAAQVQQRAPEGDVVVVCGPGNNGGDGWVAARTLHGVGRVVRAVTALLPGELRAEAAEAASAARVAGVAWTVLDDTRSALAHIEGARVVVDAVFGFGFRGPAREPYASAIEAIGNSSGFIVSADVPSGVDSDTGAVDGPAVHADVTVTFSMAKPGLFIYPGAAHAGEVVVADIGVPANLADVPGALELPLSADLRAVFPAPAPTDHKGSRGRVAIVAGSVAYAGAAVLAIHGALRMGAGYVIAVVPEPIADVVRISVPNVLVRTVPAAADGSLARMDALMAGVADADAVVAGPGLTTGTGVAEAVRALVTRTSVPLVLDADALNVLAGAAASLGGRAAPLVITPHPGEAGRLLGITRSAVQTDRVAAASTLAENGAVCLLKGAHTIVVGQGRRALVQAGNAGLARAGSGDVLSGMLGTLLAQRVAPFDAAVLGAHLHGRAAEYGTARLTETCFTATDIVAFLPDAVREVLGG